MRATRATSAAITRWGGASLVLLVTLSSITPAHASRLSIREAERAIDLGWQAELAGDREGAKKALIELVETSTLAEEAPARERIQAWLDAIALRESAFRAQGNAARAYHAAFLSLRSFGAKRSEMLWSRAIRDLPRARLVQTSSSSSLRLRVELVRGQIDRAVALRLLEARLEKEGLGLENDPKKRARYEVRLNLDAADQVEQERGVRVNASASMIVRELGRRGEDRLVASISKHRTETRRMAADARKIAIRRALDDAADSLVFQIRAEVLRELAGR